MIVNYPRTENLEGVDPRLNRDVVYKTSTLHNTQRTYILPKVMGKTANVPNLKPNEEPYTVRRSVLTVAHQPWKKLTQGRRTIDRFGSNVSLYQ